MKRTLFVCALLATTAVALGAQEANQSNPYEGTSNPPPDSAITTQAPQAAVQLKPSPSHRATAAAAAQPQAHAVPKAQPAPPPYAAETVPNEAISAADKADGTDAGIVQIAPPESAAPPSLSRRAELSDPDGDIVHVAPPPPGELPVGTTIRARLLGRLSTVESKPGDPFRAKVASDVLQDGQVLIPAGAEIEGKVASVSSGHAGGHGSMRLLPETVVLPNGSRFHLYAQLSGAPETRDRVGYEGVVTPGSRLKKDGIEYGGGVGVGAVTGAILGGPGGALAGTIVGASLVSVHLLVNHPQATLDYGTVLLFTLSEPLNLVPARASGS
jgi:hypothetical protein